ncbi:MAG: hypothetical protein JWM27_3344 [Gemmatimonadetes bacterium]|nr:hypothetical protein [Gemmatimonadota bacterium]
MPTNPPMTLPLDPHLLAQWRFDERKRWEDGRDPAQQGVSMVLGRWPDRLEFRSRTEVPGVADSARSIASTADAAAYRAQLLEVVGRITALGGVAEAAAPAVAAVPADDAADADDWLSRLDARLSSPPPPAAQDATHVAPPASAPADAELPDFLAPAPWEDAAPAPPEDAFYVPPAAEPPAPEIHRARDAVPAVPVLDFVVEPEEPRSENGAEPAGDDSAAASEALPVFAFDRGPAADDPISSTEVEAEDAPRQPSAGGEEADAAAVHAEEAAPEPTVVPAEAPAAVEFQGALPAPEPVGTVDPAEASTSTTVAQPSAGTGADTSAGSPDAEAVRDRLAALGREMGMGVWGRGAAPEAGAAPQVDAAVASRLAALDVVWTDGGRFVGAFLVAPASAAEGLLGLADVLALQPGVGIPFYVVASESSRQALRRAAGRPTFARLNPPLADACRFIAFEALDQALSRVSGFLRYLRPEFVESLAERL